MTLGLAELNHCGQLGDVVGQLHKKLRVRHVGIDLGTSQQFATLFLLGAVIVRNFNALLVISVMLALPQNCLSVWQMEENLMHGEPYIDGNGCLAVNILFDITILLLLETIVLVFDMVQ